MSLFLAAVALGFIPAAFGHGAVTSYIIGGQTYQGVNGYNGFSGATSIERPWPSYNPLTDPTDPTFSCNNNGGDLSSAGGTQISVTVAAGSSITSVWTQWTHDVGETSVWLAACGASTCNGVNSASLNWFKIDAQALLSGTVYAGTWAVGEIVNTLKWTATIPSNIAPGAYLYRNELLAIHTPNAPQWYPECAQLIITGSGTVVPGSAYTCKFPGCYSMSDPYVDINIYDSTTWGSVTTYDIPGPPCYPGWCTSSGSGSTTVGTTTSPTTTHTSTTPTTTHTPTTTVKTTTTPVGNCAALFGQCGGIGWTGATCCSSGTCKASNAYYSQCLS